MREALICAWRTGEGAALSANWSRSFRIDVDCRSAELKRAFCGDVVSDLTDEYVMHKILELTILPVRIIRD